MIGNKQRMPKKARYPLFIIGLAIIILGSLVANFGSVGTSSIGVIAFVGFALLILSVAIK